MTGPDVIAWYFISSAVFMRKSLVLELRKLVVNLWLVRPHKTFLISVVSLWTLKSLANEITWIPVALLACPLTDEWVI